MIKTILIDDEYRAIDAMSQLIQLYCPEITIMGTATNIAIAADLIQQYKPDLVFLDVEMPGGSGFQLLEQLEQIDFEIIFVTAYQEYAIRAIRFCALDYLLKPVSIRDLQEAVRRFAARQAQKPTVRQVQQLKDMLAHNTPFQKIVLSDMAGYHFLTIADIIYCEANENYTHFIMSDGTRHTASKPLKDYEELFEKHHFFRIHKSFLINLDHVVVVSKDFQVVMSSKTELPLSVRKRTDFFTLLKALQSL
ncbi:LytR/AlgR family response regulator transcription factor [Chitinophagaceae bacterium MMS25-I14]